VYKILSSWASLAGRTKADLEISIEACATKLVQAVASALISTLIAMLLNADHF